MSIYSVFFPRSLLRHHDILLAMSILSVVGTSIVLSGGIWDSVSHALKVPDTFWTIQHVAVYSGVSIVTSSAILGMFFMIKTKKIILGLVILFIGSILQIVGGYVDYNFHELFGIDGLVTSSHLTIESGLVIESIGSFLVLLKINHVKTKWLVPISITSILFSSTWIIFNISLLFGATLLCIPVYNLFSSGCSVM